MEMETAIELKDINLVRKIAWSFHKTTGLEWDDLFQEGIIAYIEALETYDENKSKLSTYAWHCITSKLKNYWKKETEYRNPLCCIEELHNYSVSFFDFWDSIPEKLIEPLQLILKNANLLDICFFTEGSAAWIQNKNNTECRKSAKQTIISILQNNGYNIKGIELILKELEDTVRCF